MFGNEVVILFIMTLLKRQDGTPLFDGRKAGGYISWDIILLSAFIMCIGNYLTAPETGVTDTLFMYMAPFTQFSPWVFIILCVAVGAVVTNFANNLVLTIALMPFMITYLAPTGMDMTLPLLLFFDLLIGVPLNMLIF